MWVFAIVKWGFGSKRGVKLSKYQTGAKLRFLQFCANKMAQDGGSLATIKEPLERAYKAGYAQIEKLKIVSGAKVIYESAKVTTKYNYL